ncbi:MAG: beta-lactamase family protein, partial [Acetobacteraceae bacterium]|nr:beta-lactamase family protein [Acetobacteraceae bacterium]
AARPEEAGFDAARLARIPGWLRGEVERGVLPGAAVAVARDGKLVLLEGIGFRDRAAGAAMPVDGVFRIASMTKAIVSVAALMLAEEGRLRLIDPVAEYIPALRDMRVGIERPGEAELAFEAAARPFTIHDLLRHTAGLGYGLSGTGRVDLMYREARITRPDQTMEEFIARLAALPLLAQPGRRWEYSVATDVLGRVLEVVTGQDLATVLRERVTGPLGMTETGFWADGAALERLAAPQPNPQTGQVPPMRDVRQRPRWFSGGGGMVSTAAEYGRFLQTLLEGGRMSDGPRLLARSTVAFMTANHVPPGAAIWPALPQTYGVLAPVAEMGQGFGLGFAVRLAEGRNPAPGNVGDYSWAGATGCYYWVDPAQRLWGVLLTQAPWTGRTYRATLRQLVYAALDA